VHPIERRGLGRTDVGADVLDDVVPEGEQLAVGAERCSEVCNARCRVRCGRKVLEPVLRPAHRHSELPRGESDQDDVRVDRGLRAEAPAGVLRRDEPQARSRKPKRGGGDRVQGERPLEVRPRRERAFRVVPVADDAVAFDGVRGPAREGVPPFDDELRGGERRARIPVEKRAVGDDPLRLGRDESVHQRIERFLLDDDQVEGILGDVAVARDNDGERLTDVARDIDRSRIGRRCIRRSDREGT
jgi:hypothetical protein